MRPEVTAALIEGAIPFLGGIVATLLGYRVIGRKQGTSSKYDDWQRRYVNLFKVGGPFLMLFGVYLATSGILKAQKKEAEVWKRYTTDDGACSAEFPGPPVSDKQTVQGIESRQLSLTPPDSDTQFQLSFADLPAAARGTPVEDFLDGFRDRVLAAKAGQTYALVREERVTQDGVRGRAMEFAVDDGQALVAKVFIADRRIYRIAAVTPRHQSGSERVKRFLDSIRFEKREK